jgi:hypothetical protein
MRRFEPGSIGMMQALKWAALALAVLILGAPAFAGEAPTMFQKYVVRIAEKPPIDPNTFTAIPKDRKGKSFYSCGAAYCESESYCCPSSEGSSYCCPGNSQCGGDGWCY